MPSQITVVEEDSEQHPSAPPPTARQTAAGAYPGGISEGDADLELHQPADMHAAKTVAEQPAGTSSRNWLGLPAKFGFLSRSQLSRRRSSRAGGSSGAGGPDGLGPSWASFDDAESAQYAVPLLEYDMQQQVRWWQNRTHSFAFLLCML